MWWHVLLLRILSITWHHYTSCILVDPTQVILLQSCTSLSGGCELMPIAYVFFIVKVLAPLNQVVYFIIEISIFQLHETFVVERILI